MTLATKIVVFNDGEIRQVGPPAEIYDTPNDIFVAGFIGTPQMNFFDALVLVDDDGKYQVRMGGISIPLSESNQKTFELNEIEEQQVTIGIRPQNLKLRAAEESPFQATAEVAYMTGIQRDVATSSKNSGKKKNLTAAIELSEHMGAEVYIHFDFKGQKGIIVVPAATMSDLTLVDQAAGADIAFDFSIDDAYLFDKETGKNLISYDEPLGDVKSVKELEEMDRLREEAKEFQAEMEEKK